MEKKMLSDQALHQTALKLLKKFYGYDSFRSIQYDVIEHVVQGGDAVVLMPTGGGKSVCFQIPALMREGCTIVISPLLALMKDQVDGLRANGIPAAAINSMQTDSSNREIVERTFSGQIKLLYISPERLLSELELWSSSMKIGLIAVDEAHCISQWGHDFRPEYTKLSVLKKYFPNVPIMALTATADKLTREDIEKQLGLDNAKLFISSFDRPNLSLNVAANYTEGEKLERIAAFVGNHPGQSGIVYCLSRANTEKVAEYLTDEGYRAACYHAGLSNAERQSVQQRFLNDDIDIICATIAFGMGIDKSNIRWVIHFNMPKNVECYYQEIGRAGRDGMPSETMMFYSYADVAMLNHFVEESGQQLVNREKLKRMQEYAEANICRRRMLLSYFNERYDHDCGNCDVCNNPPERFDGTELCQKAISAAARTDQSFGLTLLIDVLRGMKKRQITDRGYDCIKTFGVGANLSALLWNRYILQMIQLGIFEIAYNEGNHLKITPYGWDVVKSKAGRIYLSKVSFDKFKVNRKPSHPKLDFKLKSTLVDLLKTMRHDIAKKENVPPYIVFSDAVIQELANKQPVTIEEFAAVEGIGEKKLIRFGKQFLSVIRKHRGMLASVSGFSENLTLFLLKKGYGIDDIARIRELKENTVCSHIAKLIQFKKITRYENLISESDYKTIIAAYRTGAENWSVKLTGRVNLNRVPIALAIYRVSEQ